MYSPYVRYTRAAVSNASSGVPKKSPDRKIDSERTLKYIMISNTPQRLVMHYEHFDRSCNRVIMKRINTDIEEIKKHDRICP
jgi:hypothetical protein